MTVESVEHKSQVAELSASRDTHEAAMNAERLAKWQRRYPHDLVDVPPLGTQPERSVAQENTEKSATVTPIRKRGKA